MKIGIITHYYGSMNYGGVLQSFALVEVLHKLGFDAEQVCFPYDEFQVLDNDCLNNSDNEFFNVVNPIVNNDEKSFEDNNILLNIKQFIYDKTKGKIKDKIKEIKGKIKEKKRNEEIIKDNYRIENIKNYYLNPRKNNFSLFRKKIPHSKYKYTLNSLFLANEIYDIFITGSDQVWNLKWQNHAFFLEFVDNNKKKIAYAASAGMSTFDEVQQKYLKRTLKNFDAISVREIDLVESISKISGCDVEFVLDPTLLLDLDDWNKISSERLINEKYLFCFFYNPINRYYELAKQYALKHNLKIVNIPYAIGYRNNCLDDGFGDYKMGMASPEDFISLVRYSECVFTDSFHCNVLSVLYNRPFFIFDRINANAMGCRIKSLNKLFNCEDRFCFEEKKQTIEYLETIENFQYIMDDYEKLKMNSFKFLIKNLS